MQKRILKFHDTDKGRLIQYFINPLLPYFEDSDIEDLQVNNYGKVFLIKRGGSKEEVEDTNINQDYIKSLHTSICAMNNKVLSSGNIEDETMTCMLPISMFRYTGIVGKSVNTGVSISIRLNDNVLMHSYSDFGINDKEFDFLKKHISEEKNSVFFIGATGSGKTTFANILIQHIPNNQFMRVIGDIHDFSFTTEHKFSEMKARNLEEYRQQFDIAMRQNPDRILIPELSSDNTEAIRRTMSSGHNGFILTAHADVGNIAQAFSSNLAMNNVNVSADVIDKEIKKNIAFVIQLHKDSDGKRKIAQLEINNKKLYEEANNLYLFKVSLVQNEFKDANEKTIQPKEILNINKDIDVDSTTLNESRGRKQAVIHRNLENAIYKRIENGESLNAIVKEYKNKGINIPSYKTMLKKVKNTQNGRGI